MSSIPSTSSSLPHASSERILDLEETNAVRSFLRRTVEIESMTSSSTTSNIVLPLEEILTKIYEKLREKNVPVDKIFLIGSAASHLFQVQIEYQDIDIQMTLDIPEEDVQEIFNKIPDALYESLFEMMLQGPEKEFCEGKRWMLPRMYINKKFFMNSARDVWSLFSLYHRVKNVELKFVQKLERSYQFSTDSIKIDLTSVIRDQNEEVVVKSSFGNIEQALQDIRHKRIRTREPENIFGGGFLKYCTLMSKNFENCVSRNDQRTIFHVFVKDCGEDIGSRKCALARHLVNHFQINQSMDKKVFLMQVKNQIFIARESPMEESVRAVVRRLEEAVKNSLSEL